MSNRMSFDMSKYANDLMSGWAEAIAAAGRPAEGDTKAMIDTKTVEVKCVYPQPDDGVSYSWVKMNGE